MVKNLALVHQIQVRRYFRDKSQFLSLSHQFSPVFAPAESEKVKSDFNLACLIQRLGKQSLKQVASRAFSRVKTRF